MVDRLDVQSIIRENKQIFGTDSIQLSADSARIESADSARIELESRRKIIAMRSKWSWTIIVWISVLILFHIVVTILVGCNVLDFSKQKFLIQTVIGTNFLEIVGMGVIVIKFLYPAS